MVSQLPTVKGQSGVYYKNTSSYLTGCGLSRKLSQLNSAVFEALVLWGYYNNAQCSHNFFHVINDSKLEMELHYC
jgi:hypothetical protein